MRVFLQKTARRFATAARRATPQLWHVAQAHRQRPRGDARGYQSMSVGSAIGLSIRSGIGLAIGLSMLTSLVSREAQGTATPFHHRGGRPFQPTRTAQQTPEPSGGHYSPMRF
jgi:hypothetical protein